MRNAGGPHLIRPVALVLASLVAAQGAAALVFADARALLLFAARWDAAILVLALAAWILLRRRSAPCVLSVRGGMALGVAGLLPAVFLVEERGLALARSVQVAVVWLPLLVLVTYSRWRARWREAAVLAISASVAWILFLALGDRFVAPRVAREYRSGVDHRPAPLVHGANEDGLYTPLSADQIATADTTILFLGDSFVANPALPHEQRWPQVTESALRAELGPRIHCLNAGWVSSSPLLQARLLRELGAKYRPDWVVQCLDMSDPHDDWRVEVALRALGEGTGAETRPRITRVLSAAVGSWLGVGDLGRWLRSQVRPTWAPRDSNPLPATRYFHLGQPALFSESAYLRTWRALLETRELSRALGAGYLLVLLPRYQQYEPDESPRDWERPQWPKDRTYVQEPLRWFEERARAEGVDVISLRPTFRRSGVFPTCFEDDPHWNEAGNRIAGLAVAAALRPHLERTGPRATMAPPRGSGK